MKVICGGSFLSYLMLNAIIQVPHYFMSETLLRKVLDRGVVEVYPSKQELEKALKERPGKLTFYLGVDPSSDFLHLGHTVPVRKLEQLRQLGCKVILLIGGFTATVGDPTDKLATRKALTIGEVKRNSKNYLKLVSPVLKTGFGSGVKVRDNNEWWGKMKFSEFMNVAQKATVQRLLERDMFQERIKNNQPIYLHEFTYPLLQGYDSVAMNVDGEVGGNDQTFNMLMGRNLSKEFLGKDKFVISVKLLVDPSGKKMGKSEGNAVPLTAGPKDMFGVIMSWPDTIVTTAFELLTDVEMSDVAKWEKELSPRDLKAKLAYEITKIYHGEKKAEAAQNEFDKIFKEGGLPDDIKEVKIAETSLSATELLIRTGLASSKSDARRTIEQGGMAVNEEVVKTPDQEIKVDPGLIVRRGKRQFAKIV